MKHIFKLCLILGLAGSCTSQSTSDQEGEIYWVNSQKADCMGVGPRTCLQVQKGEERSGEWQLFYASIEGFDYQPGFLYKLSVRETELPPEQVPADGSSIRYELLEVLEKEADQNPLNANRMDLQIEDTKWLLTELLGRAFTTGEGVQEAYLILDSAEGRYAGNNSCNTFNGTYELKEGNRITFGQGMSSLRACPDMTIADSFMQVLNRADSYSIKDNMLSLNRARMAPLARFVRAEE